MNQTRPDLKPRLRLAFQFVGYAAQQRGARDVSGITIAARIAGELQMPYAIIRNCAGLGVTLLVLSPATAAPVAGSDLSGKKFCWDGGGTENYYADGKYVSSVDGIGSWVVAKDGVQIKTNQIAGIANMQKLPDGTFTSTWIVNGAPKTWTGRYCE